VGERENQVLPSSGPRYTATALMLELVLGIFGTVRALLI
jgi:hypothetical protein